MTEKIRTSSAMSPKELASHTLILFGTGIDGAPGRLIFTNYGRIDLMETYDLNQQILDEEIDGMKLLSNEIGINEDSLIIPLWDTSESVKLCFILQGAARWESTQKKA